MKEHLLLTDREITHKIATVVKKARIKQKLSQDDLADRVGVSKGTIVNFEKDTTKTSISLINLISVLRALSLLDRLKEIIDEK